MRSGGYCTGGSGPSSSSGSSAGDGTASSDDGFRFPRSFSGTRSTSLNERIVRVLGCIC